MRRPLPQGAEVLVGQAGDENQKMDTFHQAVLNPAKKQGQEKRIRGKERPF